MGNTNKKYASIMGIKLGKRYLLRGKIVIPFDAEEQFSTLGLSAGFIHYWYEAPDGKHVLGQCGSSGVSWFVENALILT